MADVVPGMIAEVTSGAICRAPRGAERVRAWGSIPGNPIPAILGSESCGCGCVCGWDWGLGSRPFWPIPGCGRHLNRPAGITPGVGAMGNGLLTWGCGWGGAAVPPPFTRWLPPFTRWLAPFTRWLPPFAMLLCLMLLSSALSRALIWLITLFSDWLPSVTSGLGLCEDLDPLLLALPRLLTGDIPGDSTGDTPIPPSPLADIPATPGATTPGWGDTPLLASIATDKPAATPGGVLLSEGPSVLELMALTMCCSLGFEASFSAEVALASMAGRYWPPTVYETIA